MTRTSSKVFYATERIHQLAKITSAVKGVDLDEYIADLVERDAKKLHLLDLTV